jgi:hypothetical protein
VYVAAEEVVAKENAAKASQNTRVIAEAVIMVVSEMQKKDRVVMTRSLFCLGTNELYLAIYEGFMKFS